MLPDSRTEEAFPVSEHDLIPEPLDPIEERTVTNRMMEMLVSGLFVLVAIVVIKDSIRVGAGWAFDGPAAGYFPFYIGCIMLIASSINFLVHLLSKTPDNGNFVNRSAAVLVLKVLIPTAVFIGLIGYTGFYLAAGLFITFFMVWLGRYRITRALPVGVAVPLFLFWLFEIAFLIPLPKGPIETALGF